MLNGVSKLAKLLASDDIKRRKRGHKYVRELLSTRSGADEFEMSYMDILGVCKGLFYSLWMQDKLLLQEEVVRKIVGLISSIKSKDIRSMYIKATFDILSREWGNLDVWRQDKFMMLARDFFVRCLLSLKRRGINQETFMAAVFQCVLNASIDVAMDLKLHLINVIKEELPKSDVKPTLLYSFFKNALETLLSIPRGSTYASSMIYLLLFLAGKMRRFKKLPLMEISEGLLLLSTKVTGYSKTLKRLSKAFHVKQALVKEDGSAEKQGSVGNEAMKIDEPAAMKTDEPEGFSVVTPIASPRKRKFESESAEAAPDPISRKRKRRRKGKEVDVSSSLSEETPFSATVVGGIRVPEGTAPSVNGYYKEPKPTEAKFPLEDSECTTPRAKRKRNKKRHSPKPEPAISSPQNPILPATKPTTAAFAKNTPTIKLSSPAKQKPRVLITPTRATPQINGKGTLRKSGVESDFDLSVLDSAATPPVKRVSFGKVFSKKFWPTKEVVVKPVQNERPSRGILRR